MINCVDGAEAFVLRAPAQVVTREDGAVETRLGIDFIITTVHIETLGAMLEIKTYFVETINWFPAFIGQFIYKLYKLNINPVHVRYML